MQVERVISCRVATDGRISYLVRWKGYGMYEDTWEPEENLNNCKDAILKFFNDREVQPKKSVGHYLFSSLLQLFMVVFRVWLCNYCNRLWRVVVANGRIGFSSNTTVSVLSGE